MSRAMKDSGIPWIGEIPEEWVVKRLKYSCKLYGRIGFRGYTTDDLVEKGEGAITLSPSNFDGIKLDFSKCSYLSWQKYEESPEIMVSQGDVLLVKTASVGKCVYVDYLPLECTVNPQILVLKEHKDSAKFIAYIFQTQFGQAYIDVTKGGTSIPSISQENIGKYSFIFPPVAEQEAIAEFLDRKCGEVDELVALQEQMIEELKAYKQSIITEAVTKGLNPNAPMKPSNIDWIGPIPAHWEEMRLKFIGEFQNGLTYTPSDVCGDEGTLVLRSSNIQDGKLVFNDNVYVNTVPSSLMVEQGDIIICSRNGSASLVGKCALVQENIIASFGAFMVRFRSNIDNRYALYLISTVIPKYKVLFTTTTINQLTKGMLSTMVGIVPPRNEQREIADYLDQKCADIDALINIKQQKIEDLKQYKKSLIYEYVTGKK